MAGIEEIKDTDLLAYGVRSLPDRPNVSKVYGQSGMSASALKAHFDKNAELIADKVNEIISYIYGSGDAGIASLIQTGIENYGTLDKFILSLSDGKFAKDILKLYPDGSKGELKDLQSIIDKFAKAQAQTEENVEKSRKDIDRLDGDKSVTGSVKKQVADALESANRYTDGEMVKGHYTPSEIASVVTENADDNGDDFPKDDPNTNSNNDPDDIYNFGVYTLPESIKVKLDKNGHILGFEMSGGKFKIPAYPVEQTNAAFDTDELRWRKNPGLVRVDKNSGIGVFQSLGRQGILYINRATETEIMSGSSNFLPIVPAYQAFSVKKGLLNNASKKASWSEEEKKTARSTIGAGDANVGTKPTSGHVATNDPYPNTIYGAKQHADKVRSDITSDINKNVKAPINDLKGKLNAFLKDADLSANAVDTLKEIQEFINSGGATSAELLSKVNTNANDISALQTEFEGFKEDLGGTEGIGGRVETNSTEIENIKKQIADLHYVAIAITSFDDNRGTVEYGETVTSVTLSWNYNKTPTTLTLDGVTIDANLKSKTISGLSITKDSKKTWTLSATDERGTVSTKQASVGFANVVYHGVGTATDYKDYNKDFISGLGNELRGSRAYTFEVNPTNQYIYYCYPSRLGEVSKFSVGGFDGGFEAPVTVSFTNSKGYTENYYVYRSTNMVSGKTTINVT